MWHRRNKSPKRNGVRYEKQLLEYGLCKPSTSELSTLITKGGRVGRPKPPSVIGQYSLLKYLLLISHPIFILDIYSYRAEIGSKALNGHEAISINGRGNYRDRRSTTKRGCPRARFRKEGFIICPLASGLFIFHRKRWHVKWIRVVIW